MDHRTLAGQVELTGLPPHRGVILHMAFFEVSGPDAPPPFSGDPPTEAIVDVAELISRVDLDSESDEESLTIPFEVLHAAGHYYIQLRATLFRHQDGRMMAQVEEFFFARRSLPLTDDIRSLVVPIEWPSTAVEDMEYYATFRPGRPPGKER